MIPQTAVVCAAHTDLGKHVLRNLLRSVHIQHIYALSELDIRDTLSSHTSTQTIRTKLTLLIHPLDYLERTIASCKMPSKIDLAFYCLCSPRHVLPSLGTYLYNKLNYDIPYRFLNEMIYKRAHSILLLSHPQASIQAKSEYLKIKGELMENSRLLQSQLFPQYISRIVFLLIPVLISFSKKPYINHVHDHVYNGILPKPLSTLDKIKQKTIIKHDPDTFKPLLAKDVASAMVADAIHSVITMHFSNEQKHNIHLNNNHNDIMSKNTDLFVCLDPPRIIDLARTARALRRKHNTSTNTNTNTNSGGSGAGGIDEQDQYEEEYQQPKSFGRTRRRSRKKVLNQVQQPQQSPLQSSPVIQRQNSNMRNVNSNDVYDDTYNKNKHLPPLSRVTSSGASASNSQYRHQQQQQHQTNQPVRRRRSRPVFSTSNNINVHPPPHPQQPQTRQQPQQQAQPKSVRRPILRPQYSEPLSTVRKLGDKLGKPIAGGVPNNNPQINKRNSMDMNVNNNGRLTRSRSHDTSTRMELTKETTAAAMQYANGSLNSSNNGRRQTSRNQAHILAKTRSFHAGVGYDNDYNQEEEEEGENDYNNNYENENVHNKNNRRLRRASSSTRYGSHHDHRDEYEAEEDGEWDNEEEEEEESIENIGRYDSTPMRRRYTERFNKNNNNQNNKRKSGGLLATLAGKVRGAAERPSLRRGRVSQNLTDATSSMRNSRNVQLEQQQQRRDSRYSSAANDYYPHGRSRGDTRATWQTAI